MSNAVAISIQAGFQQSMQVMRSSVQNLTSKQRQNLNALFLLLVLSGLTKQKKAAGLSLLMNLFTFHFQAWPNKSDKFYDTTGAMTHFSLALFSLFQRPKRPSPNQILNTIFSIVWVTRLGSFLYTRILIRNKDTRLDTIKHDYYSFMFAFIMQSIWCFLGQLPLLVSNSNEEEKVEELTWNRSETIGRLLFVLGFFIEAVSDAQKLAFQFKPENEDKFIREGLWSLSRHPNHFGEICLQFGLTLSASKIFKSKLDNLAWLSPVFTTFLLTQVSGIPVLEKGGLKRWGTSPEYQEYLRNTPILIPKLF